MRFPNKVWRPRFRARKGTSEATYLILSMNPEAVGRLCSALMHASVNMSALGSHDLAVDYREIHDFISKAAKYETYNDGRKSINLEQT
jgi:hypothetical protein